MQKIYLIRASQVALVVNNLSANAGDSRDASLTPVQGLVLGSGTSPGGGKGNPLQYSRLKNSMDRGAWSATAQGAAKKSAMT